MVKVKPLATIEKNYRDAAGTAASRYRDSIPTVTWQAQAIAGQDLYVQKMSDPEILARRAREITEVSDVAFRNALLTKGAPVIASRMAAAAPAMAQGYAPIRSALEALTLPPRTGDAMQNIDSRLKPVVQTMINASDIMR